MRCQVRTSDRALFDGDAVMVVARSALGDFAVMARHAPLLAVLDAGPLRVKTDREELLFVVRGGLLRVLEDRVTVLAEAAIPAPEVDLVSLEVRMAETESALALAPKKQDLLRERAYLRAQKRTKEKHG